METWLAQLKMVAAAVRRPASTTSTDSRLGRVRELVADLRSRLTCRARCRADDTITIRFRSTRRSREHRRQVSNIQLDERSEAIAQK